MRKLLPVQLLYYSVLLPFPSMLWRVQIEGSAFASQLSSLRASSEKILQMHRRDTAGR